MQSAFTTDINSSGTPLGTPLLNGNGRVIGLVVGKVGQRLVVAPAWLVTSGIRSLVANEVVTTATLGMAAVTSSVTSTTPAGARVTVINVGLPAADAGLRSGEVITAVNGLPIASKTELDLALRGATTTSQIVLSIANGAITNTIVIPALASSFGG